MAQFLANGAAFSPKSASKPSPGFDPSVMLSLSTFWMKRSLPRLLTSLTLFSYHKSPGIAEQQARHASEGLEWHRFNAYPDRFTLLLALDDNPAPRNVLEAAALSSGRSKL
jgi:hypothetical protein